MIDYYINASIYTQVIIASLMTWGITSLGAAIVFFFKNVNKNILDSMLGLSGGVMIAASFWSLLNPAIEKAHSLGLIPWLVALIGILVGSILISGSDYLFQKKLDNNKSISNREGIKRNFLLILSITLHNIPEGLAIGVAFGGIMSGTNTLLSAVLLAVGIGIQNFPEGCAVSLPLRREGISRGKSFLIGSLSGIVEPISAVIGCSLVILVENILPFCLSFAAGAMIYVVISELIPESQKNKHKNLITMFTIIGFSIMMILDVSLG